MYTNTQTYIKYVYKDMTTYRHIPICEQNVVYSVRPIQFMRLFPIAVQSCSDRRDRALVPVRECLRIGCNDGAFVL